LPRTLTKAEIEGTLHLSSRQAAKVLGTGKSTINDARKRYGFNGYSDRGITDPASQRLDNAKILIIDIESKPNMVYTWGLWNQNIGTSQIIEPGGMICFAAKWLGSDEIAFYSDFSDGHESMVRAAFEMLSEADIVVTYNGDRYDIKRLNNEFLLNGLGKPKPFHSIDLYKVNKKQFDLPSRKLDYIAQASGVGAKVANSGFDLWVRCMANDPEAWAEMEEYNRGDITVTEALYVKLLPWLTNIPHRGMWADDEVCPYCGHAERTEKGETTTLNQTYPLFQCENCEGWSRGTKTMGTVIHSRVVR